MTLILGIETSCDETAAAVVEDGTLVRSSVVASQHELHEKYAGVVPEIASRAHLERMNPVITESLRVAGVELAQIDAIAVGNRPGLIGSLLVGVSAAKALSWALRKPLVGVDHVRAHLWAAFLEERSRSQGSGGQGAYAAGEKNPTITPPPASSDSDGTREASVLHRSLGTSANRPIGPFPALGLVISGGHTSMYRVDSPTALHALGRTIDDAIGEAYDKAAVILNVGYPGGPLLDRLAQRGDATRVEPLPRSLLSPESLDFSFSGLKTALLYRVRGTPVGRGDKAVFTRSEADLDDASRANLAAAFQDAAVESVIIKLRRGLDAMASGDAPARAIIVGGGVSANSLLRARVASLGEKAGVPVKVPAMKFCVDNAAMIAGLAHRLLADGTRDDLHLPAIATTGV